MSENRIRLAHIYLEQADVARQQSNLDDAMTAYKKAVDVYKKLALEDSSFWPLVADTIERAAATLKAAGKLPEADEAFKEAATLRERIAAAEAAPSEED
jgi:tetratricopeptide (TPR) repeat protein